MSRLASYSLFVSFVVASHAHAASFADRVVSYTPGNATAPYDNPAAALGAPSALTGENPDLATFGVNVLSPFSPAYQEDEVVRVGEGGSITLRLENFISVGDGAEFGLVENISLFDPAYPSGTTTSPAVGFGNDGALVEVSQDGVTFVGLTGGAPFESVFNMPAVYFLNAGAFDTVEPVSPILADFGKPFTPAGGFSAFDGKSSYAEVLAVFEGSGGGTWLDASASGLSTIGYIRLSVADDNDPATANTLELDSVLSNSALLAGPVPEPMALGTVVGSLFLAARKRR